MAGEGRRQGEATKGTKGTNPDSGGGGRMLVEVLSPVGRPLLDLHPSTCSTPRQGLRMVGMVGTMEAVGLLLPREQISEEQPEQQEGQEGQEGGRRTKPITQQCSLSKISWPIHYAIGGASKGETATLHHVCKVTG